MKLELFRNSFLFAYFVYFAVLIAACRLRRLTTWNDSERNSAPGTRTWPKASSRCVQILRKFISSGVTPALISKTLTGRTSARNWNKSRACWRRSNLVCRRVLEKFFGKFSSGRGKRAGLNLGMGGRIYRKHFDNLPTAVIGGRQNLYP